MTAKHGSYRMAAAVLLVTAALAMSAGCKSSEKTAPYDYSGSDQSAGIAIAEPNQKAIKAGTVRKESDEALADLVEFGQQTAERDRARDQRLKAIDKAFARATRRPSYWRRAYSFPLLYTGVSSAAGALIGSTQGHAWEGALIGAAAGSLIDAARVNRTRYPYGVATIGGAGIGAIVGNSAGSTAGGAIIGTGVGAVLDNLIYSETLRD